MSRRQGHQFATEQELGAGPGHTVQQDRVRVETVRMASGARLLLAVIADGDGHVNAGKAAEVVIEHVFERVQRSKNNDIHAMLVDGLTAGNSAIAGGSRVAATVMAIRNDRLYLAQAGHTSAFLVRKGRTTPLTQANDDLLGTSSSPRISTNSSKGEPLQAGDSIVLSSDGLTMINPEDGKPYLDPTNLPGLIADNTPLEAARHIISIAMGRDVADNLSVIVIQTPAGEWGGRKLWMVAAAFAALVLMVALVVLGPKKNGVDVSIQPVDYGYAVILSGSASIETVEGGRKNVDKLGTVPPMAVVEVDEDTRLVLQSSIASSTDVSLISIYLSAGSRVEIESVDSYLALEPGGEGGLRKPASLTYLDGSVLIVRSGGVRRLQVEVGDIVASLAGAGRTILGVRSSGGTIHVDCLQGGCAYEEDGVKVIPFIAGQSLMVSQSSELPMELTPLLTETLAFWDDLCVGCLTTQ